MGSHQPRHLCFPDVDHSAGDAPLFPERRYPCTDFIDKPDGGQRILYSF
jgi:hypothetical protein